MQVPDLLVTPLGPVGVMAERTPLPSKAKMWYFGAVCIVAFVFQSSTSSHGPSHKWRTILETTRTSHGLTSASHGTRRIRQATGRGTLGLTHQDPVPVSELSLPGACSTKRSIMRKTVAGKGEYRRVSKPFRYDRSNPDSVHDCLHPLLAISF